MINVNHRCRCIQPLNSSLHTPIIIKQHTDQAISTSVYKLLWTYPPQFSQVFNGDPENGDRPGVKDVLIIFTDGNAHDLRVALEQAEVIKSRGVRVITIGAGMKRSIWKFEDELKKMCTDPEHDFMMVDFKDLSGFANEAFPLICQQKKKRKL